MEWPVVVSRNAKRRSGGWGDGDVGVQSRVPHAATCRTRSDGERSASVKGITQCARCCWANDGGTGWDGMVEGMGCEMVTVKGDKRYHHRRRCRQRKEMNMII